MSKDCLYCGLQYPDTTTFCRNCGRPTERSFLIHPLQESEVDRLHRQLQEKEALIRQLVLTRPLWGETSQVATTEPVAAETAAMGDGWVERHCL
jgi:hypothetical protein